MTLHPPINGTEQYLEAVYQRLGQQNDLLGQILDRLPALTAEEEPSDVVELREPALPDVAEAGTVGEPTPEPEPVELAEPAVPPVPTVKSQRRKPAARATARKTKEN